MKPKLQKDKYSSRRGGVSNLLNISCSKCSSSILQYQKDGPGTLYRLYLDRIHASYEPIDWKSFVQLQGVPNLICFNCHQLIAVPMIYAPENRLALMLIRGTFSKKIQK